MAILPRSEGGLSTVSSFLIPGGAQAAERHQVVERRLSAGATQEAQAAEDLRRGHLGTRAQDFPDLVSPGSPQAGPADSSSARHGALSSATPGPIPESVPEFPEIRFSLREPSRSPRAEISAPPKKGGTPPRFSGDAGLRAPPLPGSAGGTDLALAPSVIRQNEFEQPGESAMIEPAVQVDVGEASAAGAPALSEISVMVDAGGAHAFSIVLSADGTIRRRRPGLEGGPDLDTVIGRARPELFEQVRSMITPQLLQWC